jgi:hypothetical protein
MPTTYAIPQGANYMNATLYTGTGSAMTVTNGVPGQSFQPDLVWIKVRSTTGDQGWVDSVRGTTKYLASNSTNAESTGSATRDLTSFNSNGFSLGAPAQVFDNNANGSTYVAWQWKAGGTAVSNTAGTITSSVSANTTSGFSVVTYTGNGTSGATIGHGLGVAPVMTIIKRRSSTESWPVWHTSFNSAQSNMRLEQTSAIDTASPAMFNNTYPSSTVITLGNGAFVNTSGQTYVCYAWSQIAGYSAFGSYTGNGSSDGPFIYTGFRPRWLMIKRTDNVGQWWMYDTSRSTYNSAILYLVANTSGAEVSDTSEPIDFLSNGFKLRVATYQPNTSGGTFIYAAFAENPFKYANAR